MPSPSTESSGSARPRSLPLMTSRLLIAALTVVSLTILVSCGGPARTASRPAGSAAVTSATPSPTPATPSATAAPTPTPRPAVPDAHLLTLQAQDIPPGFAPHPTSIMTLNATTVVSEEILSDASTLRAAGFTSGAEYGWEGPGHALAAQNSVLVVRDAIGAQAVLAAEGATARSYGAVEQVAPVTLGSETHAYTKGALAEVEWRHGSIVAAVEVTDGSLAHAARLAAMLDQRYAAYS